jgi:hypothetical protein
LRSRHDQYVKRRLVYIGRFNVWRTKYRRPQHWQFGVRELDIRRNKLTWRLFLIWQYIRRLEHVWRP